MPSSSACTWSDSVWYKEGMKSHQGKNILSCSSPLLCCCLLPSWQLQGRGRGWRVSCKYRSGYCLDLLCTEVRRWQQEGENTFHLQKLYVLPSHQGIRLGQLLFDQAIAAIKERHPSPCQMRLNVNRHNKALTFYQKMGMAKVDEGDFVIGNGYYMNDYIMGMDI